MSKLKPLAVPFIVALNLLAYVGLWLRDRQVESLRFPDVGITVGWYLLAVLGFLLALLYVERQQRFPLTWMWLGAILFRILLLSTEPTLSDDVYRYLWDGYLVTEGVSPYAFRIDAPELDALTVPIRDLANNRWMASPYLPAAHLLFAGIALTLPLEALSVQLVMVALDLATALVLRRFLRQLGQPDYRLLWYLWHPLLIIEVAHGAHLDIWMTLLAVLAVMFGLTTRPASRQRWLSPLCLALATLTKILPIFLLPVLYWRWNWGQRVLYGLLVGGVLVLAAQPAGWGLTGPLDGLGLFGALRIYADQWMFNGGFYPWLLDAMARQFSAPVAETIVRLASYGFTVLVVGLVWLAAPRANLRQTLFLMLIPTLVYLALSATIAPWYLLMVIPFLPLMRPEAETRWLMAALLFLTLVIFMSYLIYLSAEPTMLYLIFQIGEWLVSLCLLSLAGWVWIGEGASKESEELVKA